MVYNNSHVMMQLYWLSYGVYDLIKGPFMRTFVSILIDPFISSLQPCFITWVPWRWSRDTYGSRKSIWFFGTIKWFTCLFSKEENRNLNERAAISDISIMYIEINDAASRKWVFSSPRSKSPICRPEVLQRGEKLVIFLMRRRMPRLQKITEIK